MSSTLELEQQGRETLNPYSIRLGVPLCTPHEACAIYVPEIPHVFLCFQLIILPMTHFPLLPKATVEYEDKQWRIHETGIRLSTVMVMLGHGLVVGSREEDWVFRGTKKPVSATVAAYERFAQSTGNPLLDVIIACNDDPAQFRMITFQRRSIPYVYPSGRVHLLNAIGSSTRTLIPDRGAVLLARADKWNNLDPWNIYRLDHERRKKFPDWAIQSAG